MGLTDKIFSMTQPDILKEMFRGAKGAVTDYDPAQLVTQGPVSIGHKSGQAFRTKSGKLEFAANGLPDWQPDPADTGKYALQLLTAPGYFQSHTAFSGVGFLRQREGAPCAVIHPDDAAARGLTDGQKVRLHNDKGEVGLILHVRDEVQPGVILVPGQRPDGEAVAGTVNMLCADTFSDMGEGATYQSTWLDVAAL